MAYLNKKGLKITKGVIRSRKWKQHRQYNDQKEKDKWKNNNLQNIK